MFTATLKTAPTLVFADGDYHAFIETMIDYIEVTKTVCVRLLDSASPKDKELSDKLGDRMEVMEKFIDNIEKQYERYRR